MRHLIEQGYLYFPDENEYVVELLIHNREEDGTEYRDSLIQPLESEIKQACNRHSLPFDKVIDIIKTRSADTHTIIIDVPVYLKYLEENDG